MIIKNSALQRPVQLWQIVLLFFVAFTLAPLWQDMVSPVLLPSPSKLATEEEVVLLSRKHSRTTPLSTALVHQDSTPPSAVVHDFYPSACQGAVPAKDALAGSLWISTGYTVLSPRFSPEGCCRDRYTLLDALASQGLNGWGIELGVAGGNYSAQILSRTRLSRVFSVDMWSGDRGHDDSERNNALSLLKPHGYRSCALWGRFDGILPAFPDEIFDFIYIDGYAHTGQEGGGTIAEWWPKVRSGGVFGGHDYGDDFKPVIEAVDQFVQSHGLEVHLIGPASPATEPLAVNDCCRSWFVVKP